MEQIQIGLLIDLNKQISWDFFSEKSLKIKRIKPCFNAKILKSNKTPSII